MRVHCAVIFELPKPKTCAMGEELRRFHNQARRTSTKSMNYRLGRRDAETFFQRHTMSQKWFALRLKIARLCPLDLYLHEELATFTAAGTSS